MRTYPQATAGTPTSIEYDATTGRFSMTYTPNRAISQPTQIFVSPLTSPRGYDVKVTGGDRHEERLDRPGQGDDLEPPSWSGSHRRASGTGREHSARDARSLSDTPVGSGVFANARVGSSHTGIQRRTPWRAETLSSSRVEGFNGRAPASGNAVYPGNGQQQTGYDRPVAVGHGLGPGAPGGYDVQQVDQGRMTLDTVVQKTGITLGVVVLAAMATWFLTGDMDSMTQAQLNGLYGISLVGAIGGFALGHGELVQEGRQPRRWCWSTRVLQGVFVGAFSKALEVAFTEPGQEPGGLVIGAVVGTMAAVAGTLAAYKFFNIQVGTRFRKWVIAAGMGFLAVTLLDMVLGFFGAAIGFNGFGPLGLLMSVVGLGLGVLFLILDFDFVERGIAAGLPERESWRAAFGLTATIVFIYIEILRILAILRGD